jgi:hypothetical protein
METKKYKRLPYGNSNMEQENNSYLFFTRPRKFGKSLFFSMLSQYYDINSTDKFETLFGNLYIGKHPT